MVVPPIAARQKARPKQPPGSRLGNHRELAADQKGLIIQYLAGRRDKDGFRVAQGSERLETQAACSGLSGIVGNEMDRGQNVPGERAQRKTAEVNRPLEGRHSRSEQP